MKLNTLFATIIATAISLSACGTTNGNDNSSKDEVRDNVIITRTLNMKNFHGISASAAVEIHYTQGSRYSVEVEGSSTAMKNSTLKVTDGVLNITGKNMKHTVTMKGNENKYIIVNDVIIDGDYYNATDFDCNKIKLTITAPKIDYICNRDGVLTFIAGDMTSADLKIENSARLNIQAGKMEADNITIKSSGSMEFDAQLSGTYVKFDNHGSSNINTSITAKEKFTYDNSGSTRSDMRIKAPSVTIDNSGANHDNMDISADYLDMDISGASHGDITFSGGDANVDISGQSDMVMNLDCKRIGITASGMAKVRLEGTADNTEVESSGISKINTSGLNSF